MDSPKFSTLHPFQFKIPSELKKISNKTSKKKGIRKKRKEIKQNPSIPKHANSLSDFVEDKDFLKWYRDKLPITQKILNAKYIERQNFERELFPSISCQKFKSHSILLTFQEKFAREVLQSTEYYDTFDGFEPIDDWHDTIFCHRGINF